MPSTVDLFFHYNKKTLTVTFKNTLEGGQASGPPRLTVAVLQAVQPPRLMG